MASKAQEKKWQIQGAVDTLQRAEAIKRDKGLMKDVKKEVSKQQNDLKRIAMAKPTKVPAKKSPSRPARRSSGGGRGRR